MNMSPHIVFIFLENLIGWYKDRCETTCTWNSRTTLMLDLFFGHVMISTVLQYTLLLWREKNWWWHPLLRCSSWTWWKMIFFVWDFSTKQIIISIKSCCTKHSYIYCPTELISHYRHLLWNLQKKWRSVYCSLFIDSVIFVDAISCDWYFVIDITTA